MATATSTEPHCAPMALSARSSKLCGRKLMGLTVSNAVGAQRGAIFQQGQEGSLPYPNRLLSCPPPFILHCSRFSYLPYLFIVTNPPILYFSHLFQLGINPSPFATPPPPGTDASTILLLAKRHCLSQLFCDWRTVMICVE